jgi:hypothetical protein
MASTIKESERSASVYTANWKETVELKRTLSDLTRSKKTVEHNMYLDQKLIYKRFQTKVHQSQLFLSRLKGDREMERQLRAKTVQNFNTNCGNNEEEERKLKRILRRATTSRPGATPRPSIPAQTLTFSNGPGLFRSKSVDVLSEGHESGPQVTFDYRNRGSLTSLPGTPLSGNSVTQGQYLDTSKRAYEVRPHTIQGMPQQQAKVDTGLGDRPVTVAAILEDDGDRRRRILTQINSNRIKSANFQHRVNKFCKSLNDMATTTDNALDYYNVRLQELHKKNNGCKNIMTIPKTPESEYWRHVGDYRRRPITFHGVSYDITDDLNNKRLSISQNTQTNEFESTETLS